MLKRLLFFCILFSRLDGFGQENLRPLLDTVLARARSTSMYSGSISWDSLQEQVYLKATNAKTLQELKPAFECLLNGLRDHHGRVFDANNFSILAYFTDYKNQRFKDDRPKDMETWKIVNDTALKFSYQLLKDNTGYLKIVGIGPGVDLQRESSRIRNAVIELTQRKASRWIIDLRYNGGGNMYPMMAGIAPLIGDGVVGKLVSADHRVLFPWTIREGNFTYDVPDIVSLPNKPVFTGLPPIAVLTSRWTVSSGELVATALKGRPNTRFFGEATGGYASNVGWDPIGDKIILAISTGFFCDRNGKVYADNIPVDEEIVFELTRDLDQDKCVAAAIAWLRSTKVK